MPDFVVEVKNPVQDKDRNNTTTETSSPAKIFADACIEVYRALNAKASDSNALSKRIEALEEAIKPHSSDKVPFSVKEREELEREKRQLSSQVDFLVQELQRFQSSLK